jgi:hypothetical protein
MAKHKTDGTPSASTNQVVLQQWFGELPDGTQIEKTSFQIFIEGPEVSARRGKDINGNDIVRELIGFVGKNPGEPVNFLPVIDAFRDLLPQIRVQIAQGLIQWREAELEKAKQLLAEAEAMGGNSGDAIVQQFSDQAKQAAAESLAKAEESLAVETKFARSSEAPDHESIKQFVESIMKPAEEVEVADADEQNL